MGYPFHFTSGPGTLALGGSADFGIRGDDGYSDCFYLVYDSGIVSISGGGCVDGFTDTTLTATGVGVGSTSIDAYSSYDDSYWDSTSVDVYDPDAPETLNVSWNGTGVGYENKPVSAFIYNVSGFPDHYYVIRDSDSYSVEVSPPFYTFTPTQSGTYHLQWHSSNTGSYYDNTTDILTVYANIIGDSFGACLMAMGL